MNPLIIKNVAIGKGIPKICVSIAASSKFEILETAKNMLATSSESQETPFDILEWRVDWFGDFANIDKVYEVLKALRDIFPSKPIIFTFRTSVEGGEAFIETEDYINLNRQVIECELADIVDLEFLKGKETLRPLIQLAHEKKYLYYFV